MKILQKKNNIKFIYGDELDVLSRLIKSCEYVNGTDIFRITTESPFFLHEKISDIWKIHKIYNNDLTTIDDIPDGSGFEIIKLNAYKISHKKGKKKTQIRILFFIYPRK